MMEADRVLRPLREAEGAIDRLDTYESPAVLTEALRATSHAVERTLRSLLRSDASAPDEVRLSAMSPEQMSMDTVLTELRRRDLISIGLAGRMHELRQALERGERGDVRASDADVGREVVRCVTEEVHGAARRSAPSHGPAYGAASHGPLRGAASIADADDPELDDNYLAGYDGASMARRPAFIALGAGLLVVAVAMIFVLSRPSALDRGVEAFSEGRKAVAEQHFRTALEDEPENNTARLYLARILREQDRNEEAAQLLRAAAESAPEDDAVRRELGYLFIDLDRAPNAAEQFRRAVELNPEEPLNWVGLIESLGLSGDPSANEWLRRAPAEAQEMIRQRRSRAPSQ